MANPQIEDGHTKIANEIMDALCKIRIPGEERQILDVILRKTYGWNKCEDAISLSQFVEMTGIIKTHVIRAINGLLSKKVIIVTEKGNAPAKVYKINKDYEQWEPLPKKVMLPKKVISITEKGNPSLPKKVPTKATTTKAITKAICTSNFEKFWILYPKKKSKGQAERAFYSINPDEQLMGAIMESIERAMTQEDWVKENGKYVPYPATWLNAKGWEDEIIKFDANLAKGKGVGISI